MKRNYLLAVVLALAGLEALPPPPPLAEIVRESDAIVLADLKIVSSRNREKGLMDVTASLKIQKIYKRRGKIPGTFRIIFPVAPDGFGKQLKTVPRPGKYILFLVLKKVAEEKEPFTLYEPNPYAIRVYNAGTEEKIEESILLQ